MSFTYLSSSEDREQWLADRRGLITATDAVTLATSGTSGWLRLKAEKAGHSKPWTGNRYTQWGHEREPVIAAVMQEKYPWLEPNSLLVRSDDDPRWGATPDMVGDAGLCQIKTDLRNGDVRTEPERGHVIQTNWELLVTGMEENILVYEPYEETEHGFQVVDPFAPLQEFLIERDEELIAYLIGLAEKFLNMGDPSPMDGLLADYAEADARLATAKDDLDQVKEKIRHEIGDVDSYKHVSELGSVTLSAPKPRRTLAKDRIEQDFDLADEHYKTITPEPSLRVTPAKDVA